MKRITSLLLFGCLISAPLLSNGCAPSAETEARRLEALNAATIPQVTEMLRKQDPTAVCREVKFVRETPSVFVGYAVLTDGRQVNLRMTYDKGANDGILSITP